MFIEIQPYEKETLSVRFLKQVEKIFLKSCKR